MTKPWEYQKELQKQEVPNPEEIYKMALDITDLRIRALFILGYLTGGRITELIGKEGVKKEEINRADRQGREIVLISMINRKHKKRHRKEIPVALDRVIEQKLFLLAYEYIDGVPYGQPLFQFTKSWAHNILRKTIKMNPHYLRHIRATHLVVYYDFNEALLMMFMGWTDPRPAKHYMELRWTDLLQKI